MGDNPCEPERPLRALPDVKRLLPALALLAVLVPAVPGAQAGSACPVVSDPRGDASSVGRPDLDGGVTRPGDDVLVADFWSDAKELHVLVTLAGLPEEPAGGWETETLGFWWMATLERGDHEVMLEVLESHGRYSANAGWAVLDRVEAGQASVPGPVDYTRVGATSYRVDRSARTLRVDVPLSVFPPQVGLRRGQAFDSPSVTAMVFSALELPDAPPDGIGVSRDRATSDRTVVIGSRACAH